MGEAKRRGTFEERKAAAIAQGRRKLSNYRPSLHLPARDRAALLANPLDAALAGVLALRALWGRLWRD